MSILTIKKAFRIDKNAVKILYFHNSRSQEFLVEWNNIHAETGETNNYDLQIGCLSNSGDFNIKIENVIKKADENDELYIALRDTFSATDCDQN